MRAATLGLLAVLAAAGAAFAQDPVRVWSTLSARAVPLGETTVLELHIETSGAAPQRIEAPALPPEVDVVGTRDYSQIRFSLPGGRTRLVRRELVLRPNATGRFRIPPFAVTIDGQTYRTQAIELVVTSAAAGQGGAGGVTGASPGTAGGGAPGQWAPGGAPGAGNVLPPGVALDRAARGPDDEVLFAASLIPDTVYVGEQVTLRADVLVSERAQFRLRRAPEYMPPDAPGFWAHDLPGRTAAQPQWIGGQLYLGRSVSRAYFPISAGVHTLGPARLVYEIRRGALFSPQSHELKTDSLRIVVLPLPEAGRPATFTGAVGRFEVRARLEPDDVPAGEATALTVEVEGDGHIKALPPPALPELDGIQVFPPSEHAEIRVEDGVVTGTKRFTWVLVPDSPGRIELPPIEYAYFDPALGAYATARSAPLAMTVRPGPDSRDAPTATPPAAIRTLMTRPAGPPPLRWVRKPWFGAVMLLPVVAMLGILALRRRDMKPARQSRRELRRRLDNELEALRKHAGGDPSSLLRDLERLIRTWLADRLEDTDLLRAEPQTVAGAVEAAGVDADVAASIADLLARIARARFEPAPTKVGDRLALIDEAERLLRRVDGVARSARAAAAGAALSVLILLAAPALASAQEAGPFEEGLARFREERYEAAAEAFAAFVAAQPEDAAGWYNLGVAYHEAGERGRAAWAWLRAARLAPRNGDVRHNLRVAAVDPRLVRDVLPPLPLSQDELIFLAGAFWLLGAGAGASLLLRRRRTTVIVASVGVALAVTFAGAWAADRLGAEVAVTFPSQANLLAAPHLHAEPLRVLEAGSGVEILERRDGWLRVRSQSGAEGWIDARDVGAVRERRAYGAPPAL